ncbi:MAG: hypothetical protein Q7K57_05505 [Burkholderiaceae bacterium]|nr:hypothetical protein [Burkholderiaceae bacterium]
MTNRRLSPLRDLDVALVKSLCQLHPWGLGRLCANVGLSRMALSHFFAGRRPLPQKEAVAFLKQIGLTVKGEIDPRHCFVLLVRAGLQDLAIEWIARLFPKGGVMLIVNDRWPNGGRTEVPPQQASHGAALYDGEIAAVVHISKADPEFAWLPGDWEIVNNTSDAEGILATEELPTKDTVRIAIEDTNREEVASWRQVQVEAEGAGLSAYDVLQRIRAMPRG